MVSAHPTSTRDRRSGLAHALASAAAMLIIAIGGAGCGASGPVPEAPEPRRPAEQAGDEERLDVPDDCIALSESEAEPLAAVKYRERSVVEAQNLADEGFEMLTRAENPNRAKIEREELITTAVNRFITALLADPYNVHATYNLAAAYARIGRGQCAVNLLDRMAALHRLGSFRGQVEAKLDRLLGRGKFRNDLDPDFHDLRDQENFREVIKKFRK